MPRTRPMIFDEPQADLPILRVVPQACLRRSSNRAHQTHSRKESP